MFQKPAGPVAKMRSRFLSSETLLTWYTVICGCMHVSSIWSNSLFKKFLNIHMEMLGVQDGIYCSIPTTHLPTFLMVLIDYNPQA